MNFRSHHCQENDEFLGLGITPVSNKLHWKNRTSLTKGSDIFDKSQVTYNRRKTSWQKEKEKEELILIAPK